jgi:thiamine pyrophosphokinase
MMKRIVIFANGELQDGSAVRRALDVSAYCIAADGGAQLAQMMGLPIALLVGDMDSITPDLLHQLEVSGCEIKRYPAEKDETDLELALLEATQRGAEWVRVIGALGGRLDQMLANIYLLNLPALQGRDVRLVAGKQTAWIIGEGEHLLDGEVGDTISLLPLMGSAEGISTQGLKYPLHQESLFYGTARGVSNQMIAQTASLQVRKGRLLVIHTEGQA